MSSIKELLHATAQKWQDILDGKIVDLGADNCPLCAHYRSKQRMDGNQACKDCPAGRVTYVGCMKGPYQRWWFHQLYAHDYIEGPNHKPWSIRCPECKMIAFEVLTFVQSLEQEAPDAEAP